MTEKAQINPEKLKVLSAVMDKIEKDFGKGAIMKMSSKKVDEVPVIPSGSITTRSGARHRRLPARAG